jgi:hypothetical protein
MFDDEMTEADLARTSEEYYRVTNQEIHEEKMACAIAYISALEAQIFSLKSQRHADSLALVSYASAL